MKSLSGIVRGVLLALAFAVVQTAFAAEADDTLPPPPPDTTPAAPPTPPSSATTPAPAPAEEAKKVQVEKVGPLEIQAVKATVRLSRLGTSTCIAANLRLRIKNASSSDVKVALLLPDFGATDDLGQSLLAQDVRWVKASGATFYVTAPRAGWVIFLGENAANLTTLSPGQTVEAQIVPHNPGDQRSVVCTNDPPSEMMKTYRPTTYSLSGSIGIVDLDGNAQVRSFSLLDVPLQASR